MKIVRYLFLLLALLVVAGAVAIAARFDLSAVAEPSHFEASLASATRRWIIPREARKHPAKEASSGPDTIGSAGMTFNGDCAFCHGQDGAFGKSLSDDQIWDLVHYIRTLSETGPGGKPPEIPSKH